MELSKKTRCGNTVQQRFTGMERLELWTSTTRRQHEALRRATLAADLAAVLWCKMTDEQRQQLENDDQVQYLIRSLTSSAYGIG